MPVGAADMPIKVDATFHLNSELVIKTLHAKTRRAFSRAGGYVRTTAKRSIKKRAGTSPKGEAPYSHSGLLKNFIFYQYDPRTESVIIGPEKISKPGMGTAPRALEHGGTAEGYKRTPARIGDLGIISFTQVNPRHSSAKGPKTVKAWGKTYEVQYARIRNDAMLRRVRENERKIFGDGGSVTIAVRPYMRPALAAAINNMETFFN